ncbi:MAG: STAS domain-containing protein [bacterium]
MISANTDSQPASRIEVAVENRNAFVRVIGKGSYKMGPALKNFGLLALEQGCRYFVLDMAVCSGMDSTFMGVVAGLTVRIGENSGQLVMVQLSDKNRALLDTLGLAEMIRSDPAAPDATPTEPLPAIESTSSIRATETIMLQAHETLVALHPANAGRFRDVLIYLRESVAHHANQP